MDADEQAIRDLISNWMNATAQGDLPRILELMAEDVVFLLPGQPPMKGREPFAKGFETLKGLSIEATSDIQEIQISGGLAYCWNHLSVAMTPKQVGAPMRRSGYTLTILKKNAAGRWQVYRDANLLTSEA